MKASDHSSFVPMSIIAFIIPLVGFILGVVYLGKDSELNRRLGVWLFGISLLFFFFWIFIFVLTGY